MTQKEEKLFLKGTIVKLSLVLKLTMRQLRRNFLNTNGWESKRIHNYKHKQQEQKHKDTPAPKKDKQQNWDGLVETIERSEGKEFSNRSTASTSQIVT